MTKKWQNLQAWRWLAIVSLVYLSFACATTQQQGGGGQQENNNFGENNAANFNNNNGGNQQGEDEYENDYGNQGGDNYGNEEGNNYGNEGNYGGSSNYGAGNYGDAGEAVNNAGGEEFSDYGGAPVGGYDSNPLALNNSGSAGMNGNFPANDGMADMGESVNNATEPDDYGAVATNATGGMQGAVAQPAMDTGVNPAVDSAAMGAGQGVVRYVVEGGGQMYQEMGGSVVKNLEQGDHPLVFENGEWSRTSDGYYIPATSLTSRPVGRLKQPAVWY